MTLPTWLGLFAESEPQATIDLMKVPERFIFRATEVCEQLEAYIWEYTRASYPITGQARVFVLTDAMSLNGCLISLIGRARCGQCIAGNRDDLIEKWDAFLIEGGPELSQGQSVLSERKAQKRRAQNKRKPGLPKRAVMIAWSLGFRTTATVENFFYGESNLTDKWGTIDVELRDGAFIITDITGDADGSTLSAKRIPKLISEIKLATKRNSL